MEIFPDADEYFREGLTTPNTTTIQIYLLRASFSQDLVLFSLSWVSRKWIEKFSYIDKLWIEFWKLSWAAYSWLSIDISRFYARFTSKLVCVTIFEEWTRGKHNKKRKNLRTAVNRGSECDEYSVRQTDDVSCYTMKVKGYDSAIENSKFEIWQVLINL